MYDRILNTRYRIMREIGQGGMGHVYLALDLERQQDVAIKTLEPRRMPSRVVGQEAIERFRREANILKGLRHNNIVEFLDYFIAGGNHYIVMEYVSGGSLRDRIKIGPLFDSRDVCEIGMALVSALTAAHDLGIVHRDIKPSNILFAEDGTVRLSDFGVARLKAGSPIDRVHESTVWGQMPGTIAYMAPETLSLAARPDERSDIWSLGVVLYEMLVGQPPFLGQNAEETATLIRESALPPLSVNVPYIWPALELILKRMLIKDPAERYPGMRRLGADLEDALREEGVIRPASTLKDVLQRAVQRVESGLWGASRLTSPAAPAEPGRQTAGPYSMDYARSRALLIAPGSYEDQAIPSMPEALRGAILLAEMLHDRYGFETHTLMAEEVTLDAVQQTLGDFQDSAPDDRLILYWAGAARTRPDRYGYERGFLAAHDTRWKDWQTFLEIDNLIDVRFIRAKHVLFILDAPVSGPAERPAPSTGDLVLEAAMRSAALHTLTAGPRRQPVQTPTSLFTGVLLEGLTGQAAQDGVLSADTLGAYVVRQVSLHSNGEQKPIYGRLAGGQEGSLLFRVPTAAYLPREVWLGVRSAYPSVRHGMVQVLRDFALQPQDNVQQAALDQLEHLAQHDPMQSVKDAARRTLLQLLHNNDTDTPWPDSALDEGDTA